MTSPKAIVCQNCERVTREEEGEGKVSIVGAWTCIECRGHLIDKARERMAARREVEKLMEGDER